MQRWDTAGDGCPETRTTVSNVVIQAGLDSPVIESDSGRRRLHPSLDAEYRLGRVSFSGLVLDFDGRTDC